MKKPLILILILSMVLMGVGCGGKTEQQQAADMNQPTQVSYPQDLVVSLGESMQTFDASQANDADASVLQHLFEGLYRYDASGACVNAIAQAESVDESGLVWTFTLRQDALWSDGQPVRAQDFVYAWRRAVTPETQSAYAQLFLPIKNAAAIVEGNADPSSLGVEAVGDFELKVTFTRKVFRVSTLFVHFAFSPMREDLASGYDMQSSDFDACALVTNGAYRITQFTQDGMTLVKSDSYYAKDSITQDSIQFLFLEDEEQYRQFTQKNLYYADNITDDVRLASFGIDQSPIVSSPAFGVTYLALHHDAAPLDNADVRNALLLSVRQQDYADACFNAALPATGLVPASFSTPDAAANFRADNTTLLVTDSVYAQNLLLAKNLLTEAGYEDPSVLNTLEFIYDQDDPMQKSLAELLVQNWKDALGFTPTLVALDAQTFQNRLQDGEYAIAITQFESETDDPSGLLGTFITGAHANVTSYASGTYDALMVQAQNAPDNRTRYDLYHQAESQLLSDAAVIPLLFHTTQGLQSDALQDVVLAPNGTVIFAYSTIESGTNESFS